MDDGARPPHFIRQWRKAAGLTQAQLASRVERAVSTISQIETGMQGYSQATLEAIAEALDCEPADLLMRDPTRIDLLWMIRERIEKAPADRQKEVLDVLRVLLKIPSPK